MPQGHAPAHCRVRDRHHAVAAARVVLPQVPAERVEVWELPAVQDATQQQRTCREEEAGLGVCDPDAAEYSC